MITSNSEETRLANQQAVGARIDGPEQPGGAALAESMTDRVLEREERYRALFDLCPVAVYSCDSAGVIQEFNRHAAELWLCAPKLGDTAERFFGPFKRFLPDGTFLPYDESPIAQVLSGAIPEARDKELLLERPDGSRITIVVNTHSLTNHRGEHAGAINCFYDITDRKHAENLVADSLNRERELAEFRETFIGIVGHDLRNPLGAIVTGADLLVRRNLLDAGDAQTATRILRSGQRMTGMITQLLDLTRARLGGGLPIAPRSTDLRAMCQNIIAEFDAEITLDIAGEITGTWDADRMAEALSNLIGNAIEYAAPGTGVIVKARRDVADVVIEVTNRGAPIPAEVLPFIFDPFRRAHRRAVSPKGNLGLGLFIARQILLAHGGSLDGRSSVGATTFCMRLPLHSIAAVREAEKTDTVLEAAASLLDAGESRAPAAELSRLNRVAIGRELRMIELKNEIDELRERHGEAARHHFNFAPEVDKQGGCSPDKTASPTELPGDGIAALESIVCTEELHRRPSRPPDYEAENRALTAMARALAESPRTILQQMAEIVREVFKADSAGMSLLTKDEKRFYWPAIAGMWKPHMGGGTPRDFGPCGDVLDCNAPMLFTHFERRYPYLAAATPPAEECLLVPFHVQGKAVGTIWAISHDDRRKFDAEDLRQLESLGRFAAAAYQAVELQQAQDARLAALNLMEDAVQANEAMEGLNAELRENEERLRITLEATQVGQWDLDLDTDTTTRSLRHDQIYGYEAPMPDCGFQTILHKHVHPDDRAAVERSFQQAVAEGTPWEVECRIIRTDDALRWVWAKGNVYEGSDGKPRRMLGLLMDITERKRLENELRQYGVDLSEADRRKNEFLAMLGHELRNPLSALAHGLELLGKVAGDGTRAEELRAMMVRQTQSMGILIGQMLDIARVLTGKVTLALARVDMADAVRAAVETVRPLLDALRHRLTVSLPPAGSALVSGDMVRLSQVVENLLGNAVKCTNEGGRIAVVLEVDRDKGKVRLIIRDNGIGMDATLLPRVFEVFTQAPRALDRAKGGLGLGLPLVQRLMALHEGEVTASSAGLGQGSEFIVTLPLLLERRLHERADHGDDAPRSVPPRNGSHRILVVDDEEDIAGPFADLLELGGHETLAVNDGPAALLAFRTFGPDVVLLDLGLPDMDGYEVAKRLREAHGGTFLLIAVTGYKNDSARLEQAGFDHHLVKPPDMRQLSGMISAWSATSQVERDLRWVTGQVPIHV